VVCPVDEADVAETVAYVPDGGRRIAAQSTSHDAGADRR
jgi:hypothetical protein